MMSEPIRGKVAKVLSNKAIVLNVGSSQDVVTGMRFDVMGYIDVQDPDSAEYLEAIEILKVRVEVSVVQEKVSVATTYRKEETQEDFRLALQDPLTYLKKSELIKTDNSFQEDDDWKKIVKTGDVAIQVLQE